MMKDPRTEIMRKVPPGTDKKQKVLIDVPLHITGVWRTCWGRDEYETGSVGAGIVIEPGVRAKISIHVRESPNIDRELLLNGKKITLKNIKILEKLIMSKISFKIECKTNAPLGAGYGMSAALCIIYSIALHNVSNIEKAIEAAHLAEVRSLLGLGDVIAETYGGELEIRLRPGSPRTSGKIVKICYRRTYNILTTELAGALYTDTMLRDKYSDIVKYSQDCISHIIEDPALENFLYYSYMFSKKVGFLNENIEEKVRNIRKMLIGYYVKKRVLVMVPERDYVYDVYEYIRDLFGVCRLFTLTRMGVHVRHLS